MTFIGQLRWLGSNVKLAANLFLGPMQWPSLASILRIPGGQEGSLPPEPGCCRPEWVKQRNLAGLLQTCCWIGHIVILSNAWEKRTCHFIQKSELMIHHPPGDFFVSDASSDFIFTASKRTGQLPFLCLLESGLGFPKESTGRGAQCTWGKESPRLLGVQPSSLSCLPHPGQVYSGAMGLHPVLIHAAIANTQSSFLPCAAREPVQYLVVACQCSVLMNQLSCCRFSWSVVRVWSLFRASLPFLWLSHRGLALFPWKHSVGHTLLHGSCLFIQPPHTYMLVCVDSYMHMFIATSSYVDLH